MLGIGIFIFGIFLIISGRVLGRMLSDFFLYFVLPKMRILT